MPRRAATRPAREVLKLADAAIFNLIIGSADAHAKNFSLLRAEIREIVLAPLYDLVATHIWPELSAKLAMRFGGAATLEEVDGDTMTRMVEQIGLSARILRNRVKVLTRAVINLLDNPFAVPGLHEVEAVISLMRATLDRAVRLALKTGSCGPGIK